MPGEDPQPPQPAPAPVTGHNLPQPPQPTGEGFIQTPWSKQPMSLQSALVMALTTALISSFGTGGGLTMLNGGLQQEVSELRRDIADIEKTVEEIYRIVDTAHPRNIGRERDRDRDE